MQLLTFAVASLEDPRALQPALESLGRRHVHYGVEEYQYDLVGTALLSTLENILGTSFSPELREAWQAVYTQMADVMKEAARHTPTSTGRNDVHPTIEGSTPETGKHPPLPGHEIPQPWNRLKKRFPGKSE